VKNTETVCSAGSILLHMSRHSQTTALVKRAIKSRPLQNYERSII